MKVLAICASPRKGGNSDVLCDQFLKGAAECGNEVRKINLANMNISPCAACYGCTKSHRCVKNDDMEQILQELMDADKMYLRCLPGAKEKGIIYGTGTWDKGDVYRHPSFEKTYEMGRMIGGSK